MASICAVLCLGRSERFTPPFFLWYVGFVIVMRGYVYILTNATRSVLYIGVTNDLLKRVWEHRSGLVDGFTRKYRCRYLVYFEEFGDIVSAIEREKVLKRWRRKWKEDLIEERNPEWRDLYEEIVG